MGAVRLRLGSARRAAAARRRLPGSCGGWPAVALLAAAALALGAPLRWCCCWQPARAGAQSGVAFAGGFQLGQAGRLGGLLNRASRAGGAAAAASGKGFGASAGGGAAKGFAAPAVDAPAGGWPTVSVVVLSPEGKFAGSSALQQLADQDYPLERIREVVVGGAEELASEVPAALRPLLRDFAAGHGAETLNLPKELGALTGDVVAIWGDDHVSPAHRLKQQVATALAGGSASLLQPTWFFDPLGSDFLRVSQWPSAEYQEFLEMQNRSVPEGFAKLMVCADPLTLCGSRAALLEAAANVKPCSSPTEELKELLQYLSARKPTIIEDLSWAAVRSPPEATRYAPAKPDVALQKLTQVVWPKGKGGSGRAAIEEAVKEIRRLKMKPANAVERLLAETVTKPLAGFDLKRLRQVVDETLESATASETVSAIKELLSWDGLVVGKGDAQAARDFPVFFAAFAAVREHIRKNAEFWDMRNLGDAAEALVRLASKIWGADAKVNDALVKALAQELYRDHGSDLPTDRAIKTADITGTLGLREVLETIAYSALSTPHGKYPVDALASLAWGLSEANVDNAALSNKVARGIMAEVDKLTPPDVGKIFIAMEEKRWFKDANTIGYLTESLVQQVKEMKKRDPGLARILAESAAAAR